MDDRAAARTTAQTTDRAQLTEKESACQACDREADGYGECVQAVRRDEYVRCCMCLPWMLRVRE
jgi:hypothetical protein